MPDTKVRFYDYLRILIDVNTYNQLSSNPVIKDMVRRVLESKAKVNKN